MMVKKSSLVIIYISLIALLTYSFPFSSYLKIASVSLVAIWLIIKNFNTKVDAKNLYIFCYILFVLWGFCSYFWASSGIGVREQAFNMFVAIFVNIIMTVLISLKNERIDDVIKWLFPVMLIYLVQAVVVGYFNADGRFSANGAVNQFGISASYVYLISLYVCRKHKLQTKLVYFVVVLSALLTIFTGSRKALVNLVLFTCLIFLFEKYDKNVLKNLMKVLGIIAIATIFIYAVLNIDALYNVIGKRLVSLFAYFSGDVEKDLSALRRSYMRRDAIELFFQHPIKGIGLNNFKYVARYGTYAHSNLYEILCCLGVVGEILYYIPFVITIVMSFLHWKRNLPDAIIPFAIFVSVLINEFSNVSYIYPIIHLFLGVAAGLMFVNQRCYKKQVRDSLREVVLND